MENFGNKGSWGIPNPIAVEEAGRKVTVDDVRCNVHICRLERVKLVESCCDVGVNELSIFIACDPKRIRTIADNVLHVF